MDRPGIRTRNSLQQRCPSALPVQFRWRMCDNTPCHEATRDPPKPLPRRSQIPAAQRIYRSALSPGSIGRGFVDTRSVRLRCVQLFQDGDIGHGLSADGLGLLHRLGAPLRFSGLVPDRLEIRSAHALSNLSTCNRWQVSLGKPLYPQALPLSHRGRQTRKYPALAQHALGHRRLQSALFCFCHSALLAGSRACVTPADLLRTPTLATRTNKPSRARSPLRSLLLRPPRPPTRREVPGVRHAHPRAEPGVIPAHATSRLPRRIFGEPCCRTPSRKATITP